MVNTRRRNYSAQKHTNKIVKFAHALGAKITALKNHATVIVRVTYRTLNSHNPESFNAVDYQSKWQIVTMPIPKQGPRILLQNFEGGIRLIEGDPDVTTSGSPDP